MTGRRWARLVWFAPYIGGTTALFSLAFGALGRQDWINAACLFVLGGNFATLGILARSVFIRGWHRGFVDAWDAMAEMQRGRVPALYIRQQATGRMEPEPWDVYEAPGEAKG